nr:hypothetical protein [Tanacetum cinerariifolium]
TFCDHTEETRSGNTTTHADYSLPEYDSFCFEIEPDQERLINVVKNDISDDSTNDPLLEDADLFLTSDISIPPEDADLFLTSDILIPSGIENFAYDSEGDIHFLEELLIDDSIPFLNNESSDSNFKDNPDISQIQDVDLREKLLSITRLIANIESFNDNPTPDCVLNSFVSNPIFEEADSSLSDNFSPEFETFCDHTEETRSGKTTTHANDSLPEYDSFCFEIEPDQERLINVLKNDISDDLSNDPLLEEANLFLAFDNSIPPGIENFADDSEEDVCFLEELLIDDSIPFPNNESPESDFDNPSIPRPPPEPPDAETDACEEIPVVMNDKDKFDEDYYFSCLIRCFFSLRRE